MVTLMILALGSLASMIGIMAALDHSLMNEMRNDAMKIAQEQLEAARNMPSYTNMMQSWGNQTTAIQRNVRKIMVNYNVNLQALDYTTGSANALALLQCRVTWLHKGPMDSSSRTYSCVLQTIVRQTK
jgi:hypothetical protein